MEKRFKCKNCGKTSIIIRKDANKRMKKVLGYRCPKHYWIFEDNPCCEKPDADLKFHKIEEKNLRKESLK